MLQRPLVARHLGPLRDLDFSRSLHPERVRQARPIQTLCLRHLRHGGHSRIRDVRNRAHKLVRSTSPPPSLPSRSTKLTSLDSRILYIATLVFMSMAIHRHRLAGKPITSSTTSAWTNASREEKHNMQPMPAAQTHNNNYAPSNQAPASGPVHYEHQPQQAPGFQTAPAPVNEVYGGNRYP